MILVRSLRLGIDESEAALRAKAARELSVPPENITELIIKKKSLDARKKSDIHRTYSVAVTVKGSEKKILSRSKSKNVSLLSEESYEIPKIAPQSRPVIVGFGPAGMFAALVLSMAGAGPIVIERGSEVGKRMEKVELFRSGGRLDPECNVQFGEGGAGTFSDGKLNTNLKYDKRIFFMLGQFVKHGAPEHILYDAKPHIGTDVLVNIVRGIRETVTSLGGEVRFETKLAELLTENGAVTGIVTEKDGVREALPCTDLILAIGHSARDTFEMLNKRGIPMEPKPFSMGVRIEHKQADIDLAQYGDIYDCLPAADYSLAAHLPDGTSAYTFCMCPGGEVIAAASEADGIVTNGMSRSARDGENANAALLVTLQTEDFPYGGALGGMYWQREIEKRAYNISGSYKAPCQTVGDFLAHKKSTDCGRVMPSYRPGVHYCDIHEVLPDRICSVLENALPELGKKLSGFDSPEALMTAPETRSSSPVRILRGKELQSSVRGLYPCGEGAGYAGGITSAASDGIRCAEAVIEKYKKTDHRKETCQL